MLYLIFNQKEIQAMDDKHEKHVKLANTMIAFAVSAGLEVPLSIDCIETLKATDEKRYFDAIQERIRIMDSITAELQKRGLM